MYEQEIKLRAALGYPPFSRLANIKFSGENEEKVATAAKDVASFLRTAAGPAEIEILGPAPAPLARIKNRYRWQLLLKSRHFSALHGLCEQLLAKKPRLVSTGVRMSLDIDPENMM